DGLFPTTARPANVPATLLRRFRYASLIPCDKSGRLVRETHPTCVAFLLQRPPCGWYRPPPPCPGQPRSRALPGRFASNRTLARTPGSTVPLWPTLLAAFRHGKNVRYPDPATG